MGISTEGKGEKHFQVRTAAGPGPGSLLPLPVPSHSPGSARPRFFLVATESPRPGPASGAAPGPAAPVAAPHVPLAVTRRRTVWHWSMRRTRSPAASDLAAGAA